MSLEGFHLEGLHAFLTGAYVNAVAAAETVENVDSLNEVQPLNEGPRAGIVPAAPKGALSVSTSVRTKGRIEA